MLFGRVIILSAMLGASPLVLSPALAQQSDMRLKTDETQLRSFAKAYVEVQKLREFYEPQLGTTQDPQKANEIEREARSKMTEAIAREGLTLDSYGQIVQTANADDALRKRIIELINEEKRTPRKLLEENSHA